MKRLLSVMLCVMLLGMVPAFAENAAYTEEVVSIQAEGYTIPATLTLPSGADNATFPAVVMCHGNGSNRSEAGGGYDLLAPELAKQGIASLRFDYIGNGGKNPLAVHQ